MSNNNNNNNADYDDETVLPQEEPPRQEKASKHTVLEPASSDSDSDSSDNDQQTVDAVAREPFLAFVPKLTNWGIGIVGHEANTVRKAVVQFPTWSSNYANDTYTFYRNNPKILFDEIVSGFTVAIMQVPESIAFSFVAGVPPLSGLHATFWMATITGILGGKPGMISGAAGALAVVVADLTIDDGVLDYLTQEERLSVLFMTMFVCGIIQILMAIFRLASFVRLIPETGMIGFMNGLAIIIFMAQLPAFQKCDEQELFIDCQLDQREWLTFHNDTWQLVLTLIHVAVCMAIMKYFPKVPKVGKIIPASLVALLVGTLFEHTLFRRVFDVGTRTVEETAEMSGSLPHFVWPKLPQEPNYSNTLSVVFSFGITLAAIGNVESVLTLQACNEITDTVPKVSDANQEMFAQGLANLVSGLFQAMGGDAMIGQSTINIMNGARHRVSSTMSGIFMLLFVVALSGFIELLPVATLTGVLFMVVLSTFQWKTFTILRYGRLSDSFAILLVTAIAVWLNLAVAIAAGVVFSALVHAWDSGDHVDADIVCKRMLVNGEECDVKYVHLRGAIFFSSARHFVNMFSVSDDPKTVIIDFRHALIIDHSAVAAIQGIAHRFAQVGKRVLLVHLPKKCHGRLHRTGDHAMLKHQITHGDNLEDVEDGAAAAQAEEEEVEQVLSFEEAPREEDAHATEEPAATTTATAAHTIMVGTGSDHVDETTIGTTLNHLAMFDLPIDGVESEVQHLSHDQGKLSIHNKRD